MTVSARYEEIKLPSGTTYKQPLGFFINNEFHNSSNNEKMPVVYPVTGEQVCELEIASSTTDLNAAVKAAKDAFPIWKSTPATVKRNLFFKLADLVEQNWEILAEIESFDTGKPLANVSRGDIGRIIDCFRYYGGWIDKLHGQSFIPSDKKICYTYHQPLGVVGCIIPFNYPLSLMSWKWTAIACGNTAVFKSAEQTPLTILYFAQLVEKAGFPPGVFNVVTGYGKDLGDALVKHLDICKIAFTGSTFAGQLIQKNAAVNLKALTLECGGKSPIVIFDDCKFEQAVKWTCIGIFSNMGQICSGTSRCYVQAGIYDKFIEALVDHLDKYYKIGDPFDDKTMVGPLITKIQQQRVLEYISTAIKEGCELVYGGLEKPQNISKCLEKGFYVRPTIFKDVEPHHTIFKEEVFGPVISITKFDEFDKVLESCNDNQYGLGAAIFTQDITRATVFAREIEAGMCWINSSNDVDMNVPFGGIKMSGVGRELGEYGLANFTNVKAVHLNLANDL